MNPRGFNEVLIESCACRQPELGQDNDIQRPDWSKAAVGNYPGVTVERKKDTHRYGDIEMKAVNLPGTHSLTACSAEEPVARDYIINEKPDVVVDIIDASNPERSLDLPVQLMEMKPPPMLCCNMNDMAAARGFRFDIDKPSRLFGAPIVETTGHKGVGLHRLLDSAAGISPSREARALPQMSYSGEAEKELSLLVPMIMTRNPCPKDSIPGGLP